MKNKVLQEAENYAQLRKKTRRWQIIIFILDAIVVLFTAYALILPAITY